MEVQKKNMSVVLFVNSLKKAGVSQTLEISCQLQLRDATCSFKAQGSYKMHTKRSGNFFKSFKLLSCEKNEWSELPSSRFLQTKTPFFLRPPSWMVVVVYFITAMGWAIAHFRVFKKPSLSKWGQVHNLSCENEFYLRENELPFLNRCFKCLGNFNLVSSETSHFDNLTQTVNIHSSVFLSVQ